MKKIVFLLVLSIGSTAFAYESAKTPAKPTAAQKTVETKATASGKKLTREEAAKHCMETKAADQAKCVEHAMAGTEAH